MRDLKGWLWLVGRQAMQMAVGEVMHQGQISAYEYDFGSTTALLLFSIIVVVEDDGP